MFLMGFTGSIGKFSAVLLLLICFALSSSFTTQTTEGLLHGSNDDETIVLDSKNNITEGLSVEERQWKSLLPNIPMPLAIKQILYAGKRVNGREVSTNWQISSAKTYYVRGVSGIGKHDMLADDVYFKYKDIKIGTKFSLKFPKVTRQRFSDDKVDIASIKKLQPMEAEAVKETMRVCAKKASKNETKTCVTSLQDMLVFVTKEIGIKVLALSTQFQDHNHHNFNMRHSYTISEFKKIKSSTSSNVACHLLAYPKALFYCHRMPHTRVYQVELAGERGTNLMSTMVVCHMDTSTWSPNHIAFKQLHLTPSSTTSICHILLDTDVMWVSVV